MTSNNEIKVKKTDSKKYIKRLLSYVSPYKFYIIFVVIFAILESLASVFGPKITGNSITLLSSDNIDFNKLYDFIAQLLVVYSVYVFSSCVSNYIISLITIKITYKMRNDISKKMERLSFGYINGVSYGEVLSRIMNDVENLSSAFTQTVSSVISSLVMAVGVVWMMIGISLKMTLIFMGVIPVVGIVVIVILKKSQKYFVEYQKRMGQMNGFIEETFSGYEVVSTFDAREKFTEDFGTINKSMYNSSFKSQFLSGMLPYIMDLASKSNYIVACIMGGYMVVMRALTIGDITAFIAYSNQFMDPLAQAASISGIIQQILASAERIFEFLDAPEEAGKADLQEIPQNIDNFSDIEFKNINFGYDEKSLVIKDFSLKVKSGQTVAIVGETGSGKTTLVNILMRFFEDFDGDILLNGENIKNIPLEQYRKMFGLVTQDSWLYGGSISENIAYGGNNVSLEEVKTISKNIGADHFVESLSKGYDTLIEENMTNISEGQRQLLCIARMAVKDAPILIMDEATSSVDVFTEKQIQKSLKNILKKRTAFIIAHRLSTIKFADMIVVMQKGKITEIGTHDELMAKKGMYFDMYMSQFDKV